MKESQIEAKLGKMVRAKGGLYYKFVSPGNPGVPDRIVITADGRCRNGSVRNCAAEGPTFEC